MKKKEKKLENNEQIDMSEVPHLDEGQVSFAIENDDYENLDIQNQTVSEGQMSIFNSTLSDTIIDESVAREKLKEAIETEKPKKKRKTIITNVIFLIINVCVMGFIISACLKETGGMPLKNIIQMQGSKMWWLLAGLGLFLFMFFADTMILYFLIKRSTGKKRPFLAYKLSAVGKYFDAITPFSVGGQPSQILNLTRAGVSPGIATSVPIIKIIVYNIVYVLTILAFLIFAVPFIPTSSALNNMLFTLLKILAYLGLIVTALTSIVFLLIGSGRIVGRSMVRGIVRIGYKLRIVKDFRKTYDKILNQVLEYQSSISYLKKNKGTLFACIFFAFIEILAYFAIPFTVVMAFISIDITSVYAGLTLLVVCMTKFIICQMAAVVIPLPGGTGMMEFAFIALFGVSSLIGSANIVWGLLAWRFLTYYFTIIQGFIISTVDSIVRMIKTRKVSKKEALNLKQ